MRARPTVLSIQFSDDPSRVSRAKPLTPCTHGTTKGRPQGPSPPAAEAEAGSRATETRTCQGWDPYLQPAEGSDLLAFGSTLPCAPPTTRLTSDPRAWKWGTGLQDLDKTRPQLKTVLDALTFRYSQRLPVSLSPGRDSGLQREKKDLALSTDRRQQVPSLRAGHRDGAAGDGAQRRMHAQRHGRSRCPDNGCRRAAEPRASSHASAGTLGSWRSSLSDNPASGYWGL